MMYCLFLFLIYIFYRQTKYFFKKTAFLCEYHSLDIDQWVKNKGRY